MSDETMPVAEAAVADEREFNSYELAFHVLPTVTEGEVANAFAKIKEHITNNGGEIFDEEAPERFDLAYEIMKHIDGKNRKFTSAYFGWVRFKSEAGNIAAITEEVEHDGNILRHLVVKLTKVEEENPFRFHEALASEKMVTNVDESASVPEVTTVPEEESEEKTESSEEAEAVEEKTEESTEEGKKEVDENALDEALEKDETDK